MKRSMVTGLSVWLFGFPALGAQEARSVEQEAIRAARALSNRAIAEHDVEALASFWTDDFQIATSTSQRMAGRDANRESMEAHFDDSPDVVYVRTPAEISVFEPWDMAFERGRWEGRWTDADGRTVEIGGDYAAKWRRVGERWLIESELFSPTYCEGSPYCDRAP